ncbi:MAG: nitroreductase family protein [Thermoplasmatales archaeon]|nr:MAG: nitroreductase family protein [Thermoplasmatales archaeon]
MDAIEAILTRRSVRKYKDKNISNDLILELIETGTSAPSAGNQQPWQFIIIDDRKLIDKIPDFHPHSKMLFDAQKTILVCGDLALETNKGFWVQDCSAATQNILIAARAKGLGSCWLGVYPRDDRMDGFRKMFNLPKKVIPFSLISLGYPAVDQSKVDRYDSARIHKNKW